MNKFVMEYLHLLCKTPSHYHCVEQRFGSTTMPYQIGDFHGVSAIMCDNSALLMQTKFHVHSYASFPV